jgi:hypothetical protein
MFLEVISEVILSSRIEHMLAFLSFLTLQVMRLVVPNRRELLEAEGTEGVTFVIFDEVNTIYAHVTLLWPVFIRLFVPDPISLGVCGKLAKFILHRNCAMIDSRV